MLVLRCCGTGCETTPQLMSQPSRPTTAASAQSNPFHEQLPSLPSSPPSLAVSDGISSLRSSFSTVQRPPSSKERLRHSSKFSRPPAVQAYDFVGLVSRWKVGACRSAKQPTLPLRTARFVTSWISHQRTSGLTKTLFVRDRLQIGRTALPAPSSATLMRCKRRILRPHRHGSYTTKLRLNAQSGTDRENNMANNGYGPLPCKYSLI